MGRVNGIGMVRSMGGIGKVDGIGQVGRWVE